MINLNGGRLIVVTDLTQAKLPEGARLALGQANRTLSKLAARYGVYTLLSESAPWKPAYKIISAAWVRYGLPVHSIVDGNAIVVGDVLVHVEPGLGFYVDEDNPTIQELANSEWTITYHRVVREPVAP